VLHGSQLVGLLIASLAFIFILIARKKKRLNARFFLFWVLFWGIFIAVVLYPSVATYLTSALALELNMFTLITVSAFTLFILGFAFFSFLSDQNQKVTNCIREQALLNSKLARLGSKVSPARNRSKKKKIAIVIPARNEEHSISNVVRGIPPLNQFEKKIFVIDDGSDDNTFNMVQKNGVEVIRHPVALGAGGALKTGYLLAREWNADIIAQLDADGEHDPTELPNLLEPVLNGEADMVIGSRFLNGDLQLSATRKIGIRFYTWLVNKLTKYNLTDITVGYRVFRGDILDKVMFPSEKHWAIAMALLANRNGVRVKEVPIKGAIRKTGKSQFHELMTFILYPIRAIKQVIDVYL